MNAPIGIVWNPSKISGVDLHAAWDDAARAFGAEGSGSPIPEALWFETREDDPGAAATAEAVAAGCAVIVAAGGDGTVRAVAAELGVGATRGSGAEMGIVPLGTGNLLARNLGVPLGDPATAIQRVLTGTARAIDLVELDVERESGVSESHAFVVMAGFGIDAQMIVETDDELKSRAGWVAYVESLGRAVAGSDIIDFTLALDGREPVAESAHTLLIGNCGTLQGGITLLPDAEPDDGLLDLVLLRADGVAAWVETLRAVIWDNGLKRLLAGTDRAESTEHAEHTQAGSVSVRLNRPLALEADGDVIGEAVAFTARVRAGALLVR